MEICVLHISARWLAVGDYEVIERWLPFAGPKAGHETTSPLQAGFATGECNAPLHHFFSLSSFRISYHFAHLPSSTTLNMPSFSSTSPPISTRLADDPRPLPGAQAPLTTAPPTHKSSPVLTPPKTLPATKVDSVLPPAAKEVC
jgi:hypothetical protein